MNVLQVILLQFKSLSNILPVLVNTPLSSCNSKLRSELFNMTKARCNEYRIPCNNRPVVALYVQLDQWSEY